MPRQRFTAEQIIGKLREVEVLVAKGVTVADAIQGRAWACGSVRDRTREREGATILLTAAGPPGRALLQENFNGQRSETRQS